MYTVHLDSDVQYLQWLLWLPVSPQSHSCASSCIPSWHQGLSWHVYWLLSVRLSFLAPLSLTEVTKDDSLNTCSMFLKKKNSLLHQFSIAVQHSCQIFTFDRNNLKINHPTYMHNCNYSQSTYFFSLKKMEDLFNELVYLLILAGHGLSYPPY